MTRYAPHATIARIAALATGVLVVASCQSQPRLVTPPAPAPASDSIDVTVFLVGDAGKPNLSGDLVLLAAAAAVGEQPDRSVVVFLGDNVYPAGLPPTGSPNRKLAERRLAAQVDVVVDGARGIFVPGNHDWAESGDDGWNTIRRQQEFLAAQGNARISLQPSGGCPGPVAVDVGEWLRLIALDTQWWLHPGEKPTDPTSDCRADAPGEVTDSVRTLLRRAGDRVVGILAHHPMASGGIHGGHFGILDHLFPLRALKSWLWVPLPIVGSLYPLARASGISAQDLSGDAYIAMLDSLSAAFAERVPLFYASGHEHNLQVIDDSRVRHILVSGGGYYGHTTRVVYLRQSRYAEAESGFMRVDVLTDGRVRLGVMAVGPEGDVREDFSMWLVTEHGQEENRP